MSVADRIGLGPTRRYEVVPDDTIETGIRVTVHVQPPAWVGDYPEKSVVLDTYEKQTGYLAWEHDGMAIQDALPMLTLEEREIILNGGVEA